jgi:hypothetical protein
MLLLMILPFSFHSSLSSPLAKKELLAIMEKEDKSFVI